MKKIVLVAVLLLAISNFAVMSSALADIDLSVLKNNSLIDVDIHVNFHLCVPK